MVKISAYIPCFNSADTIARTINSIRQQTVPVSELFLIDDGSSDNSAGIAEAMDLKVIRLEHNKGRGFVRSLAMQEAAHELVFCCDSTKQVCPNFIENCLPWFNDESVAAVRGHFVLPEITSVAQRWASRHIYREQENFIRSSNASFISAAAMVRKSVIMKLGNFNPSLEHSEDRAMSEAILAAGYQVGFSPELEVYPIGADSIVAVLERFWRWNRGVGKKYTVWGYWQDTKYALKVMVPHDLRDHDFQSALLSLLSPQYRLLKSINFFDVAE